MKYTIIQTKNGKRTEKRISIEGIKSFLSSSGIEKLKRFGWFANSLFVIECR